MGIASLGGFDQLIDNMLRRRLVGIAHAKVDYIFTPRSRCGFQFIDDIEDVGRKPFDSWKVVDQASNPEKVLNNWLFQRAHR